jgi:hypothetical protein
MSVPQDSLAFKKAIPENGKPQDREAYREARNHKGGIIKRTLRDAFRSRMKEATTTPDALWKLSRWRRKRGNLYWISLSAISLTCW